MSTARGIHAHSSFKLGLRPPTPGRPALRLTDYLTGKLPPVPATADYLAGLSFGLYDNDVYGVCGPTYVCNYIRLVTAKLTGKMEKPTQDACFILYRQSGNPNFDPATGADDNGVSMQTMLDAAVKYGVGGHKVLGFAQVDVSNPGEIDAAVALFGGVGFGVDLETAQQTQTDTGTWDYSPSGDWGGHAILAGAYTPTFDEVITWAKPVKVTRAFEKHQLQEAWVVILPEHLGSKQFLDGVDVRALAADYEALTGKPFPAPLPPPPPAPPPAPVPPNPSPVPPTPRPAVTTFTGYAQVPFLGKAPIVLTQAVSTIEDSPCGVAGCHVCPSWKAAPAVATTDWSNYLQLLFKYGRKALPVIVDDLRAGKSWKEIAFDVALATAAEG